MYNARGEYVHNRTRWRSQNWFRSIDQTAAKTGSWVKGGGIALVGGKLSICHRWAGFQVSGNLEKILCKSSEFRVVEQIVQKSKSHKVVNWYYCSDVQVGTPIKVHILLIILYFQDTWYLYGIVTLNIYEGNNDSELIDEDMPLVFLLFSCTNYEKLYKTLINVSSIFHFIVKTIARIANAVQCHS